MSTDRIIVHRMTKYKSAALFECISNPRKIDKRKWGKRRCIWFSLQSPFFRTRTWTSVCQVKWVDVWMVRVSHDQTDAPRDSPCRQNNETGGVWLMCVEHSYRHYTELGCVSMIMCRRPKGRIFFSLVPPPQEGQGSRLTSENHPLTSEIVCLQQMVDL